MGSRRTAASPLIQSGQRGVLDIVGWHVSNHAARFQLGRRATKIPRPRTATVNLGVQ